MPFYQQGGAAQRKPHIKLREDGLLLTEEDGLLLTEEVISLEGLSGNESLLYHLRSPCHRAELGGFEPLVQEEWAPDQDARPRFETVPLPELGDAISGREFLSRNAEVEVRLCRPTEAMAYFYRNDQGDEVAVVHQGEGTLDAIFGDRPGRRYLAPVSVPLHPAASPDQRPTPAPRRS